MTVTVYNTFQCCSFNTIIFTTICSLYLIKQQIGYLGNFTNLCYYEYRTRGFCNNLVQRAMKWKYFTFMIHRVDNSNTVMKS